MAATEPAARAQQPHQVVEYYFHTKEELLLAGLAYLGERLTARVESHIRALGPLTPRSVVHGTLTAILPTDAESLELTRTYAGYYALTLTDPDLAARHGATPDKVERLIAAQLRAAQEGGRADPSLDPETTAAGLLALTNGLGSSVLGGQRDGTAALAVLTYHLDRLFRP